MELGLYLAVLVYDRQEELEALGLEEVVQRRKFPQARKILITNKERLEGGQESAAESKILPPEQAATEEDKRQIVALALEAAVSTCCGPPQLQPWHQDQEASLWWPVWNKIIGSQCQGFHGLVVLQLQGGRHCCHQEHHWVPPFCLHLFYVDHHNLAMEELPPGARYLELWLPGDLMTP